MEHGIHIVLAPESIGTFFGSIPITNTLFTSWLVMLVLITVSFFVMKNLKLVPGRFQILMEEIVAGIYKYVEDTLENKTLARKVFPLIATLFLFILIGNWMGLFPGIGSIMVEHVGEHNEGVSLFYPIATDLNVTLALAIISFVAIEVIGVASIGILKYAGKFVNFRSVMGFFIGIIELFSELARLVSFSFRLFGNIFAGKVMILIAMAFVPLLLPVPLMAFEFFVGIIQAAVFALLTLFFIKIAVTEPH